MNERILVSIVVPVYNGEAYIKRCLESICSQTYTDIEVIVVDDGSTDDTLEVIKNLAVSDARIKYFSKKNSGASAARNFALEKIQGKYVCFVDADDWVDTGMVKCNVDIMEKHGVDIVVNDMIFDKDGTQHVCETFPFGAGEVSHNQLGERLIFSDCLNSQCISMYVAATIREHGLTFPTNIHSGEDNIFNLRYCVHVKSGYYTQKAFYHYEMHNESGCRRLHVNQLEMYRKQIEIKLALGQRWGILSAENMGKLYQLIMTHLSAFTFMAGRENLSYDSFRKWIDQIWCMPQFTLIRDEKRLIHYSEIPKAYRILSWLLIHRHPWLCFIYCKGIHKLLGNV